MSYKVRFHPSIARDLQVIAETITAHAGTTEATRTLLEIQETAMELAPDPEKGTATSATNSAIRIAPAGREGAVVFEMDSNTRTIFVLAIAYGGTAWISGSNGRTK